MGESFDFPHVHPVVLAIHVVRDRVVEPARDVDFHPVGEVAAVVERQPQGVARFEERHVGGVVGLGSECGWTFTCSAPKSSFVRSIASCSATSTSSQPP